jgi:hypothetical protein
MRDNKPVSRLGCVPPNKYKKKEGHIFNGRKRIIDKNTGQATDWIVFCVWCGKKKKDK